MYKIVLVKYGIFLQETHKAHLFFYKKLIFLMKRILLIVKKKLFILNLFILYGKYYIQKWK